MKVTRLGDAEPLLTLGYGRTTSIPDGGTSGQAITANGSNSAYWGENVARITANGSNTLVGPFVSVLSGTGIAFAVSSNSLTISGTGPAGDFLTTTEGGGDVLSTVGASGSTETIDLTDGNVHDITLTANCTLTFASVAPGRGRSFTLVLRQDGVGSRTVTWPGSVVWPGGVAPTLSTTAGATDVLTFFTLDGGTTWYGFSTGGGATIDYAEAGDLAAVGVAASSGSSTEVPRADHVHPLIGATLSSLGVRGEILITDTPAGSPLVFADLIQNEAQDDLVYADL